MSENTNDEDNRAELDAWKEHPWYPALVRTHEALEELIPGYSISQIKVKFGGLRYYISYPEVIKVGDDRERHTYLSTEADVRTQVTRTIARAEAMCDGITLVTERDKVVFGTAFVSNRGKLLDVEMSDSLEAAEKYIEDERKRWGRLQAEMPVRIALVRLDVVDIYDTVL